MEMEPETARTVQEIRHIADQLLAAASRLEAPPVEQTPAEQHTFSLTNVVADKDPTLARPGRLRRGAHRHPARNLMRAMGPVVWNRPGGRFAVRSGPVRWLVDVYQNHRGLKMTIDDVEAWFRTEYSISNPKTARAFARELMHYAHDADYAVQLGHNSYIQF